MRTSIILLSLFLSNALIENCQAQCSGLDKVSESLTIYLGGKLQGQTISKTDLTKNELEIRIENSDYKIIAFTICYDCHSGISYDINCKDYSDTVIKPGDNFIKGVLKKDTLTFECIVLVKGGKKMTTTGIALTVTE